MKKTYKFISHIPKQNENIYYSERCGKSYIFLTLNRYQVVWSMRKKIAFGWYGGKYSHLDWLLPLLPYTKHYCEPFGGSAAVLLNRFPSPVETYNDIDKELVNFFFVLRNHKEELIEKIGLTPFSRFELENALEVLPDDSNVERARKFFVRARQVRSGLAQTASSGRWPYCKLTSRGGMGGAVSRWLGSVDKLPDIAQRLLRVQIECDSAIHVILRYDSPDTLFYCDPPYPHESRGDNKAYAYEMSDDDHRELAKVLNSVQGKVALSCYRCNIIEELYPDGKWYYTEEEEKLCHSIKKPRRELLVTNYDPFEISLMTKYD